MMIVNKTDRKSCQTKDYTDLGKKKLSEVNVLKKTERQQ